MKKILVIEDNLDIRENLAELLELNGYLLTTARDGRQGFDLILAELPDLVICDVSMPEMDGYEVLSLLKKNLETASIPFIFLTAKSEKSDRDKGMNEGAISYIVKPFTEDQLISAVLSGLG